MSQWRAYACDTIPITGRGYVEHRTEEVTVFLRRTLRLHRLFRDIRRDPVIPLKNLLGTVRVPPVIEHRQVDAGRNCRWPNGWSSRLPPGPERTPQRCDSVDALYFTTGFFSLIRNDLRAHLLIKCKDPEFRDALTDARGLFESASSSIEPIASVSGFDTERRCSWTAKKTSGEFAHLPGASCAITGTLPKTYPQSQRGHWIVTTDLSLSMSRDPRSRAPPPANQRTTSSSACHTCAAPNGSGRKTSG